jgi:pseudaminic acid synthase
MTIDCTHGEFFISDSKSLWHGQSLHQLYQKAYTPWEWHEPIFRRARERGMVAFSTPFDATAVDFLQKLDVPAFKIASFENIDLPLIRKVAATGKPMIISTGMANIAEIDEAVRAAREAGARELIILKCTSSYPADPSASNLASIPHLRATFGCQVGLSDHTLGIGAAIASIALGATVIEKHVTLKRADGGVDSAFSMEPAELAMLVSQTRIAREALGRVQLGATESERGSLAFRRSLYVVADMKPGDVFSPDNLRAIRPGFGLPPKFIGDFLGKRVNRAVTRGTRLSWDLVG